MKLWMKGILIFCCITLLFTAIVFIFLGAPSEVVDEKWFLFSWMSVATIIYAAPLTIYFLRKNKHISLILVSVLGAFLGFFVTYFLLRCPLQGWEQLPVPPAPLTKLIAANAPSHWDAQLYAQSVDGQTLLYQCEQECGWSAVKTVPQKDMDEFSHLSSIPPRRRMLKPFPPHQVIDSLNIRIIRTESMVDAHFILTKDGVAWYWENTSSLYDSTMFLLTTIVGGVLAFVVGLGLMSIEFSL